MGGIEDAVNPTNAALAGSVVTVIKIVRLIATKFFEETELGERLLPLIPVLLATAMALGGFCDVAGTWKARLMIGLMVGAAVGQAYKIQKTTIRAKNLESRKSISPDVVAPVAPVPATEMPAVVVAVSPTTPADKPKES